MPGIVLNPNQELRQKSIDGMNKHYQTLGGKQDLLRTWEKMTSPETQIKERRYLVGLGKRIRKERVLLSHSRFALTC
jgi:hypothetical protein